MNPSIPPAARVHAPSDPFELWLYQQAIAGYDRMWLDRNRPALKRRWRRDQSMMPPPPLPDPTAVPDRYSEV